MKDSFRILEAFGTVKTMVADVETRMKAQGKKTLTADEQKWMAEATHLMIELRNEYIRMSGLSVTALCEIFELSNQRIYQIRGKKKAA